MKVLKQNKPVDEDTVKTSDGKWTNKGDEGTHGKFKTKKQADAQRKAMFANGYKGEGLEEARIMGYNYPYEVKWTTENGKTILLGANKTLDGALETAQNQVNQIIDNPWESLKGKTTCISSLVIIKSDTNETIKDARLNSLKSKAMTKCKSSKKANESNEFLTKQDVDAAMWLIKHGKNASEGQIKRAQEIIKQYKKQEEERLSESKERFDVIDSDYDDSGKPWREVKKELIKKYENKGYTNVSVIIGKTDTKGLRNYMVYGDKK